MLKKIKGLKLDKHNIVKFIDCFQTTLGKAIVFEPLDISLHDYMKKRNNAPMLLSDIRTIVQQVWAQHHQMESKAVNTHF